MKNLVTAEQRWDAVRRREAGADGAFVYAVSTTGVFCRPSCASRLPNRRNVEFFDSTDDATRAGFRACKRCKPTAEDPRREAAALVVRACRLLEEEEGEGTRTEAVARAVGLSPFYFQRLFKKHVGVTPQAYRRRVVAERAKTGMVDARSVTAAIYDAGYSSSSRFYDDAGRELGMKPREARAGAQGQTVRFAVRRCSLGRLLVGWTDIGVCDVRFGESDEALTDALRERFPNALLEQKDVPAWVNDVIDAVEHPRSLEIPLDIRGTAFQQRVWQELRRIPAGETRTYTEVARAIGAPEAARAVARACATNSIAVVVPCHRVVRADGDLAGYRWGVERKRELLRREGR